MREHPIAAELFAGAGGFSEGLKQAGFNVMVANEINEHAAATYRYNHPDTIMIEKDIKNLRSKEITSITGSDVDIIVGGPPCQGFSMAGKRNPEDPRNRLFEHFVRLVDKIRPKYFIMENVPGLITMNGGANLKKIEDSFSRIGSYFISRTILNATDFGVPQKRKRLFILGSMEKDIDISRLVPKKIKQVSAEDAISDLDFLESGKKSTIYAKPAKTKYQISMRRGSRCLSNHEAPNHARKIISRFSRIDPGVSSRKLRENLKTRKQIFHRLSPNEPSPTLTTLPDDCIHYKLDRILTPREMARLQSFPDAYVFLGPKSTGGKNRKICCPQYTQIGNAVPPLMAMHVCKWLLKN